jgi:hypothetical protein
MGSMSVIIRKSWNKGYAAAREIAIITKNANDDHLTCPLFPTFLVRREIER